MVGEETPEGNASPSGLEASGRSNLPWAQVKILQPQPKIKPPEVPEVGVRGASSPPAQASLFAEGMRAATATRHAAAH